MKKEADFNWNAAIAQINNDQIDDLAKNILAKLTLKEKVSMMAGDGTLIRSGIRMLFRYNHKPIPAGVIKRLGIPGIKFTDGPRGVVVGFATCFPVSMARGASFDRDLERRIGNVIGIEGRIKGANYFGGVCINLLRHPAWGRAQETYGEDAYHLGEMGVALTEGVQHHLMACAKHYACNSMENARFSVNVKVDERTLREVYLSHFRKCVEHGVASIMNAYNRVNDHYCGHNHHLLTEILKEDWKFKGFVITDFILGIRNGVKAVNAGVDVEMPFKWRMKPRKLIKFLKKGKIKESQVDDSVLRILRTLIKFEKKIDPSLYTEDKVLCEEHVQLALEAAKKSMVLLKNENAFLPLKKEECKKICVLGNLADYENTGDHGSSRVYPPYVVTPLEGINRKVGKDIEIFYDEGKKVSEIQEEIKSADAVVIVAGYTHKEEGEFVGNKGGDRDSLKLKPSEEALIKQVSKLNDKCVVIMEGGSAIIIESWKDLVPSIIMAWYPGMEGGTAIADILFGDANPCGKLPFVVPKAAHKYPFFDKKAKMIEYGYYHGYKLMDKVGYEVAFPFGFGLSYTTYQHDNLTLSQSQVKKGENILIKVDVKNTGKVAGEEIVQLYVGCENSKVDRPIKELKGFEKVFLESGEKKTVSIGLNTRELAHYDVEQEDWIIEPGEYSLFVGSSSASEDLLTTEFSITE